MNKAMPPIATARPPLATSSPSESPDVQEYNWTPAIAVKWSPHIPKTSRPVAKARCRDAAASIASTDSKMPITIDVTTKSKSKTIVPARCSAAMPVQCMAAMLTPISTPPRAHHAVGFPVGSAPCTHAREAAALPTMTKSRKIAVGPSE
ncbi:MAG TPA: hypothetical protein VFE41_02515 [Acetobacteraceae bacterium]|jgi:hypothetical protein|nr:hypothetical protein [Acetobacteraceae bacterium]